MSRLRTFFVQPALSDGPQRSSPFDQSMEKDRKPKPIYAFWKLPKQKRSDQKDGSDPKGRTEKGTEEGANPGIRAFLADALK